MNTYFVFGNERYCVKACDDSKTYTKNEIEFLYEEYKLLKENE
jgi:hypothetical protein